MKKILIFFCFLFVLCSCEPINRIEYECEVVYVIDNKEYTYNCVLVMSDKCTPIIVTENDKEMNSITIHHFPSETYGETKTIYNGNLPIKVISFKYNKIRTYKIDEFNGKELK